MPSQSGFLNRRATVDAQRVADDIRHLELRAQRNNRNDVAIGRPALLTAIRSSLSMLPRLSTTVFAKSAAAPRFGSRERH